MSIQIRETEYLGIPSCLVLENSDTELIISLSFGPRILSYRSKTGSNFFQIFEDQVKDFCRAQEQGKDIAKWQSYGGHRMWAAPEVYPRTYFPDNDIVPYTFSGQTLVLDCPAETKPTHHTGIKKQISIDLQPPKGSKHSQVKIGHQLKNIGFWAIEAAPWAVSVMAGGGRAIVPLYDYEPHSNDRLVPVSKLSLWSYTQLTDLRLALGQKFIQIREDSSRSPNPESAQKIGLANKAGWAAYQLGSQVFIKQHSYREGACYPDGGCNAEYFTQRGFLEIESLGPLSLLEPGATVLHEECWQIADLDLGSDIFCNDEQVFQQLADFSKNKE